MCMRCWTTLALYLPVSATPQGIGDDPMVVRDKRGYVPLRKTSKNRIWDCLVLRTGSCSVAKSRGNSYAPVGARDMMMMMMMHAMTSHLIMIHAMVPLSMFFRNAFHGVQAK